jgi:hypothetical protein
MKQTLECASDSDAFISLTMNDDPPRVDFSGSPSQESGFDPAATRHAPCTEDQRVVEKSK